VSLGVVFLTPQTEPALALFVRGRSLLIGRDPACGLRLPEPTVSARHASLKKRGSVYVVADEGSKNGTLVQPAGAELPVLLGPEAPRVVLSGDRIFLGNVALEIIISDCPFQDREVTLVPSPSEVPRAIVRRALEQAGYEPTEEVITSAVCELLESNEEELETRREPTRVAEDPLFSQSGGIQANPFPLDLSLSMMALLVITLAGAALYRLIVVGDLLPP
jgi:predicted component of type VI protein secretion system